MAKTFLTLTVIPLVLALALPACITPETPDPNDPSITYGALKDCPYAKPEYPIVTKCGYFIAVRQQIAAKWNYPEDQRKAGQSGDVGVEFKIARNGALVSVRVIEPSGVPALDEHMLSVIRAAAPFPPIGPYFEKEHLVITGSFRYRLD